MKRKNRKVVKEPIDPLRIRRIPPEGFSWLDRRFVRQGLIEALPPQAILLYFFLVAVADAQGLSFYSDPTSSRLLKLSPEELSQARAQLVNAKLILYSYPLYQVLPIPPNGGDVREGAFPSLPRGGPPRGGDPVSVRELLTLAFAKAEEGRQAEGRR